MTQTDDFWGETIYTYTIQDAINDGVVMKNPRRDVFPECDIITTNLYERIKEMTVKRNMKRVFPETEDFFLGCLMVAAKEMYEQKAYVSDHDDDFFEIPVNDEGVRVWFCRNENEKLTAMLPEDY